MKTKKKNKKKKNIHKTKKQKRIIKNKYEAKKYIEILNIAYKQLTSSSNDIFNKDDYLLLPYIKQGIKKGWKILKDKNIIKEIKCNSLCMTMAILNSTLGTRKSLNQLNPVQELYLFFISYLTDDKNLTKKEISIKHAIRKTDIRIMNLKNQLIKYENKKDNRNIKKTNKNLTRQEEIKKKLIEDNNLNKKEVPGYVFKLDVCNSIDCEFLHEYQMEKGKKWNESYSKFCLHITEIFKGIVWLNMYMIFNQTTKIKGLSPHLQKINTNISIRQAVHKQDIILIPDSNIYESDIFYEDHILDRLRKQYAIDPVEKAYWVYHNFDKNTGRIDKIAVNHLENKHYVAACLSISHNLHWKTSKGLQVKEIYKNFNNFLQGKDPQPVLKEIKKTIRKIGEEEKYDLQENIENSITLHWIYIHRDKLHDFIEEYV
tara:strand:- start:254 stop:1540 length:1287 start_codon:yes stop_codon:yes gene_type:complete